jgi:hypothetical protein
MPLSITNNHLNFVHKLKSSLHFVMAGGNWWQANIFAMVEVSYKFLPVYVTYGSGHDREFQ